MKYRWKETGRQIFLQMERGPKGGGRKRGWKNNGGYVMCMHQMHSLWTQARIHTYLWINHNQMHGRVPTAVHKAGHSLAAALPLSPQLLLSPRWFTCAKPASWALLKHTRHTAIIGLWHWLLPLLEFFFPKYLVGLPFSSLKYLLTSLFLKETYLTHFHALQMYHFRFNTLHNDFLLIVAFLCKKMIIMRTEIFPDFSSGLFQAHRIVKAWCIKKDTVFIIWLFDRYINANE